METNKNNNFANNPQASEAKALEAKTLDAKALEAKEWQEVEVTVEYLRDREDIPEIPKNIQEKFDELLHVFENYGRKFAGNDEEEYEKDVEALKNAFLFAYKAHINQRRKTGEMYIIHPIATALILAEIEADAETLIAALLHDTVEDTNADVELLTELFGEDVANLVDGVTKLNKYNYTSKEEFQAENFRKMLIAISADPRVLFIKLADRLHNMRTMKHQSPEKQIEKAQETLDIYAPLAHRFGIYKIKWELEDLCLRYLEHDAYYELVGMISTKRSQREKFMEDVVSELSERIASHGIKHADIEGRPKHFYSIYNKMKNQDKDLDQIYDLFACRVIVEDVTDCYTVLGIVHEMYQPMPGRVKDYIATPKQNMYQSIHTTVMGKNGIPFEVQIRTFAMHKIAEYGIAAHWNYKAKGKSVATKGDSIDDKITWIRQILDSQKDSADSVAFMESLKDTLVVGEIFVFTPKSKIIALPVGACPIDFAYSIHSGIGNKMHGAKVNGRIVTLAHELKNGDIVEILTSEKVTGPRREWTKICKTPGARAKINAWFKKAERGDNIVAGKDLLEREIQRNGFTTEQLYLPKSISGILKKHSFSNFDDVFAAIGYGALTAGKVFGRLRDEYIKTLSEEERAQMGYTINSAGMVIYTPHELVEDIGKNSLQGLPKSKIAPTNQGQYHFQPLAKRVSEKRTKTSHGLVVEGLENCSVHISNCCHPMPGDEIIGYVTQSGGVGVHRTDCSNIINLHKYANRSKKDKEREARLIKVHWDSHNGSEAYDVAIRLHASDRRYLLGDITSAISDEHVFISHISSQSHSDFTCTINLVVEVRGQNQYDRLIGRLKGIKDVIEVTRG